MACARRCHRHGHLEAAQDLYHCIMENDPANPEVYYHLGALALQRNALFLASNYFLLAAELDPEQSPAFARRGDEPDERP
jgi:hypothetical protein